MAIRNSKFAIYKPQEKLLRILVTAMPAKSW